MMDDPANDGRRRWFGFVAFCTICIAGAGIYVYRAAQRGSRAPVSSVPTAFSEHTTSPEVTLDALRAGPHVVYRSVRDGEFGRVVVASLDTPERVRIVTEQVCERVHFANGGGVCMVDNRVNLHPPAYAVLLDEHFEPRHRVDLAGFPSRARMSQDGRHAATTVFTSGDDYVAAFSTRTTLIEHATGNPLPDLEQYSLRRDGKPWKRVDFNYWGVTFADDGKRFFATLRTEEKTYLVLGHRTSKELQVLRDNVECPSISPDGKRIAFKKRRATDGEARLHVLDLGTLEDRAVASEQRNVDDQVEWLDDEHLLYGIVSDRGRPKDAMNVWVAEVPHSADPSPPDRADPDAPRRARIFIRSASSPAVVR